MNDSLIATLDLPAIYNNPLSDFYRRHWSVCPTELNQAPVLTLEQLASTPLYNRLYQKGAGLVKTVNQDGELFLVKRNFSDIGNDFLSLPHRTRPLVIFRNSDTSLEFALWCYGHGHLPYIGDINNLEASLFSAEVFKCDSLVTDWFSCQYIEEKWPVSTLRQINIVDTPTLNWAKKILNRPNFRLYLYLAEAGNLGEVKVKKSGPAFYPAPGTWLEKQTNQILVTKIKITTPLVRYKTQLPTWLIT